MTPPKAVSQPIKLLLVEDNPGDARLIHEILRDVGKTVFDIERVDRLEPALERLTRDGVDVVLLDLGLPDSQGMATFARAQDEAPHHPIVVISGLSDEEVALEAVRSGAQDYLIKGSIEGPMLVRVIRYAIERKRAEESIRSLTIAVDQSPASVLVTDPTGIIRYVNQQFTRMTGYAAHEAHGRKPSMLNSGLTSVETYKDLWVTILRGEVWRGELQNRKKNGDIFWNAVSISPVRNAAGRITNFVGVQEDITQRKMAEEALNNRERQLQAVVEAVNDIVFEFDADGRYLSVWASDESKLARPKAELLGRTVSDVLGSTAAQPFLDRFWRVLDRGVPETFEYSLPVLDGEHHFLARLKRLSGVAGRPDTVCMGIADITERKRAEGALRDSEGRFRQLADNIDEVFFVVDAQFRETLYVSPAYEKTWGRTMRSLHENPQSFMDAVVPEDRERLVESIARVQRGEDPGEIDFRVVQPDGTVRWQRSRAVPVRDEEGKVYRIAGVSLDITERKHAEEALRESERRARTLFETVHLVVLGLDSGAKVEYVNPYFLELTGYTSSEVLGANWFDFIPQRLQAPLTQKLTELLEQGLHAHIENLILTKAGKERTISWNNTVLRDPQGRPVGSLSIGEDITDRLTLEQQFLQAQKMEAVGQLAGGVAHDFNNILTVITGNVDFLLADLGAEDRRRSDVVEIGTAARRAADLTRQLLLFGRRQVLQPSVANLNTVIANMEKMLRRLIGEDVELVTVPGEELGAVQVDVGHIEQVLMNLAVNARDAMPLGGKVTIQTANVELDEEYAATHSEVTAGRYVMLAVSDDGVGMSEETRRRIFEPFFTTKEVGKGTGLGLATVYSVVRESQGSIWVYSEPGAGATFKIYLPRLDKSVVDAGPTATPTSSRGTETVLLVEDDPAVREVASKVLTRHGYSVLEAAGHVAALEIVRTRSPIQLVLTDVVMPGMSGRLLAEALLAMVPGLKVLYMSGYTDDAVVRHGVLDSGMPFIQKPFTGDALARKVREVLDA